MTNEKFKELLEELDGSSLETLTTKNARYSSDADRLHNFVSGADISGGTTAQACWGYLTKHLVALRDKVLRNDFHDRDDLLEKCQDSINYIRFLWCIGNEEAERYCTSGDDRSDPVQKFVAENVEKSMLPGDAKFNAARILLKAYQESGAGPRPSCGRMDSQGSCRRCKFYQMIASSLNIPEEFEGLVLDQIGCCGFWVDGHAGMAIKFLNQILSVDKSNSEEESDGEKSV